MYSDNVDLVSMRTKKITKNYPSINGELELNFHMNIETVLAFTCTSTIRVY